MRKSRLEKSRRFLVLFGACIGVSAACDRPSYTYSDDVQVSGGTAVAGSFTGGGIAIGGTAPIDPCTLDRSANASPVMAQHVVSNRLAARAELYTELTDAEVAALKAGGSLIPPPPAPGAAMPFDALRDVLSSALNSALNSPQSSPTAQDRKNLVQRLSDRFKSTRSAWPNPWALRLVEHAGSEHMTPLRIRLEDDAWIVRIEDGSPVVVDVSNGPVSLQEALAHFERIAAVYYVYDDRVLTGTVANKCESGKREFALGNPAMVAEVSLHTADILARLDSDIEDLTGLFNIVRQCPNVDHTMGTTFRSATACQAWDFFDASTEYLAYQWSLSSPVELYKPTTQNLASLIDALKNDRFELDPFVTGPLSGEGGAGGDGSVGGAGGAGALGDGGLGLGGAL